MFIEKAKLPRGLSYPLRSSVLAGALEGAEVKLDTHLRYLAPTGHRLHAGHLLSAEFWPPNQNVHHERLFVSVFAVPSAEARRARQYMETSTIPELVSWVRSILLLPLDSPGRYAKQHFSRGLEGY